MNSNRYFTSSIERNLWFWAVVVVIAIYIPLFFGGQFLDLMIAPRLIEQSALFSFFTLVLVFIISGWKSSDKKLKFWIYAGVIIITGMTIVRMGLSPAERTHLFEYGLLSILIYEALIERKLNGVSVKIPIFTSIMCAGTIGVIDECIQYFIPYRVFDIIDIGFNYFASAAGVIISVGVRKLQDLIQNKKYEV